MRMLTGDPSTGKSVLLSRAAQLVGADVRLECAGPRRGATDVLAALLSSAELPAPGLSELDQRNLLSVFLQHRRRQGQRIVVVIDDAHLLEPPAWRELERLRRFEIGSEPALELLCAGRPPLVGQLRAVHGAEAAGRAIHRLDPPSRDDVASYLAWRLGRFGLDDLFTPLAVQLVVRLTGSRLGAVDVLCQMAMLLGREAGAGRIDAHVVRQAILALSTRRTGLTTRPSSPRPPLQGAHLVVSCEGHTLSRNRLGQRTMIGRSEHNDIALPSPYLSRHHATILGTPAGYYVVDLKSANGIEVNGQRTESAALCDLDVINIGPYRLEFTTSGEPRIANPPPSTESQAATGDMPKPLRRKPSLRRVK